MRGPPPALSIPLQTVAAAFNALVSMLLLAVLARALSEGGFGDYVATLSLAVVLLVLLEGGWPQRVYRESTGAALVESDRLAAGAFGHVLLWGLGLAAVGLLLLPWGVPGLGAALLCMTLVATMNLVSARMRAAGRFGLEAGWQVAGRLASALAIVGVVWLGDATPSSVFLAWAAGLAVVLALGAGRWLVLPRWRGWRLGVSLTLPFLLVDALAAVLLKGDVAVLRMWGGSQDALAAYAACTRLNEAALLLFAPVGNVLLRGLRLSFDDRPTFDALWRRWVARAAWLGTAAVAGAWLLGGPLMGVLFGAEYAEAGRLLVFTALMLPFALGNLVLVVALLARGDERWLARCLGPAAVLMVLAMGAGWRLGGAPGAAVAVALAHAGVWLVARWRLAGGLPPGLLAGSGRSDERG